GQAHQAAAGIRKGEGPDRGLFGAQGAVRLHRQAAPERQGRAVRQCGRAEEKLTARSAVRDSPHLLLSFRRERDLYSKAGRGGCRPRGTTNTSTGLGIAAGSAPAMTEKRCHGSSHLPARARPLSLYAAAGG